MEFNQTQKSLILLYCFKHDIIRAIRLRYSESKIEYPYIKIQGDNSDGLSHTHALAYVGDIDDYSNYPVHEGILPNYKNNNFGNYFISYIFKNEHNEFYVRFIGGHIMKLSDFVDIASMKTLTELVSNKVKTK